MIATEYQNSLAFAREMDAKDSLLDYRQKFHIPKYKGDDMIYLVGNSLGLQPKNVREALETELKDWETLAIEGHLHSTNPWFYYHNFLLEPVSKLVGAKTEEVVVMNTLTTNLHLMMVSFYRPTDSRHKIMIESDAFPSDFYAVESQIRFHGYDPKESIIQLTPREGKHSVDPEDVLEAIREHGDELALIMIGGVNYYNGQYFDLEAITKAGHAAGALVGFDCAHAAGNIELKLHDWDVDFAVWCTYKYLNSGPGGPGGAFVHERHGDNDSIPRFAGWWGYPEETRFDMDRPFKAMKGAAGWQLSNAQIFGMAAHKASLEIFSEAGMPALAEKSKMLTGYLEFLIDDVNNTLGRELYEIITPRDPERRGCQISIIASENGKEIHQKITNKGISADWREPDVIRVAPVPLYNSFADVFEFAQILQSL